MDSRINENIELSNPLRSVRLKKLSELSRDANIDRQIIDTLVQIESVPLTITDYRDKERFLEDLLKLIRSKQPTESIQEHILCLRYLIGSLYINFEKFWGPTLRVINVFINESKFQNTLLDIVSCHLVETTNIIYDSKQIDELLQSDDRPDVVLHRNFVFQIMARFSSYVERCSVQFMNQIIVFIQQEMLVSPFFEKSNTDNLYEYGKVSNQDESANEIVEKPNPIRKDKWDKRAFKKQRFLSKGRIEKRKSKETFLTAVKVIHAFKTMNNVHRAEEFKGFIMDFLCCRDDSVQKAAFNCLIVYEIIALKPYIANVLRILDDKSSRAELSLFSVDSESTKQLSEEHRTDFMPILLRILFGKMKGQIGKKSSGRDKADQRKTLVMRFISGCHVEEILYFFELLFHPIFSYTKFPYEKLEVEIKKNLDFSQFPQLGRFHAMMATLAAYMKSVGHLKEESLRYIFKLINIMIYHVISPIEHNKTLSSNNLSFKSIDSLKVLRRQTFNLIIDFFKSFQYYQFEQVEINFPFKHLIWPSCENFTDKNYSTPTPILQLIESYAENTIYHQFLIKRNGVDKEQYLLRHLVELYTSSKTTRPMLKTVASILRSILLPEKFEDVAMEGIESCIQPAEFKDIDALIPDFDRDLYKLDSDPPFNHEILLTFLPSILEKLKGCCLQFLEKKDALYQLDKDELIILSSLCVYVKDPHQCLLGARLLLSAIDQIKRNELILSTLKTCQTLVHQAHPIVDLSIITPVANTLAFQRNFDQRQELCSLLTEVALSDESLKECVHSIILLNATTGDVDSPDLVKMNEGFKVAFQLLDRLTEDDMNNSASVKCQLELMIHQVGFIMNNVDKYEFSIRENCSMFYEKLSSRLSLVKNQEDSKLADHYIDLILEKFVKKGLRDTNDVIKNCYIGFLRSLAINCHHINKTLGELNHFCSQNTETDFWLNLKHIQINKRANAMSGLLKSDYLPLLSPKTLSSYFLPIASGFLFTKAYKSFAGLIQNSITLIGIVCKSLNWKLYESTLNYYLGLLTKANTSYQKQNIKVITTILKNFNYDLTNCSEAMELDEENTKLEIRMKKRMGPLENEKESDCLTPIATYVPKGKKLNPSTARMVYTSVTKKILPHLNGCLHEMTRVEFEHDKQMSNYLPEKDEIKRIPIAFAIVQLLNLLPARYVLFREHLPTIFLKLASFLKSKNENIRKSARDTLIKIMCFLGPAYVPDMLRVLRQNLDKGFQIHVLNYSVHSILDKLKLNYGSLDHSVDELVDLSLKEIFGKVAEDKEVAQILKKTPEAKKTKGYDTLMILCSCISFEKLEKLMDNVKVLLKTSNDPKKVNKLSVVLQRIFTGLSRNDKFPLIQLLDFIKVKIEESIPSLKIRQIVEQAEGNNQNTNGSTKFVREDRFIIAKDPTRNRMVSKINERGNFHMVLDNCLRLLLLTLEKNKLIIVNSQDMATRLSDFVYILCICLKATSPKCIMRSLRCIYYIAKIKKDIPSFKKKCNTIVRRLFIILNLYNGPGMVQGDNLEMIGMCIKTLTVLLLRCEFVQLDNNQISALLSYIDQNIDDSTNSENSKQITAFKSLHAIVRRKIDSPELKKIMTEVGKFLVRTDDEKLQDLTIKIWSIYLLDFNHEPDTLRSHLTHFMRQLGYEHCEGRKSILRILKIVLVRFPEKILLNYFELMFQLLAQRVVNEDSKDIRRQVGKIIAILIQRLPNQRNYLCNKVIFQWVSHENTNIRILGIKLTSILLEANVDIDNDKLNRILDFINQNLKKNVPVNEERNHSDHDDSIEINEDDSDINNKVIKKEKIRLPNSDDKLYYHTLRLFKRLIVKGVCSPTENRLIDKLKPIWNRIAKEMLIHWYLPVVITSSELYLLFIRNTDLLKSLNESHTEQNLDHYLSQNAKMIIRTLCDNFITLLDRVNESEKLFAYICEALISLGHVVANSEATLKFESLYKNAFENGNVLDYTINMDDQLPSSGFIRDKLPYTITEAKRKLDLMWFSTKIIMQARKEVALYRLRTTYRREFVLKWIASVLQELGGKRASPYIILYSMIPIRELTDKGKNKAADKASPITNLAEDLLKFIKSLLGDKFNPIYSKVQLYYTKKRVVRKKQEAILKIKDQVRGTKRKLKVRQDKQSRKRGKYSKGKLNR